MAIVLWVFVKPGFISTQEEAEERERNGEGG